MTKLAYIDLPDGRKLEYEIRISAKAKNLRLKITARDGLTVIVPKGLSNRRVNLIVDKKKDWIFKHLTGFDEVRHLLGQEQAATPQAFDLPALAESWRVEYQETRAKTVGAHADKPGRVIVYGAVNDNGRCKAALRRWLSRRAKEALAPWANSLSAETGMKFSRLIIRNQRTRWGSCSANRVISLNAKLMFLPRDIVRYVLLHELCHTLELNHTARFWAYLRQFEPNTDALNGRMRDAWKLIPTWAHPIEVGRKGF